MQHSVLGSVQAYGLPLDKKILPQYLSENYNYECHSIGKWNLGHHKVIACRLG